MEKEKQILEKVEKLLSNPEALRKFVRENIEKWMFEVDPLLFSILLEFAMEACSIEELKEKLELYKKIARGGRKDQSQMQQQDTQA